MPKYQIILTREAILDTINKMGLSQTKFAQLMDINPTSLNLMLNSKHRDNKGNHVRHDTVDDCMYWIKMRTKITKKLNPQVVKK